MAGVVDLGLGERAQRLRAVAFEEEGLAPNPVAALRHRGIGAAGGLKLIEGAQGPPPVAGADEAAGLQEVEFHLVAKCHLQQLGSHLPEAKLV